MNLFFRKIGAGKPLIILHGLFGSSDNWLTMAKMFANEYEVYLIDQRNHGQSPHSAEHNYELMSADIMSFISDNHLVNPVIIGHSMGGKVVMKLAIEHPELFEKAIVVDIAPRQYQPHHQEYIAGLQSINLSTLNNRNEADKQLSKYVQNVAERQFLLKNLYRTEDGFFHWRMNLNVLSTYISNIYEGTNLNLRCELPILFIKGENSNYISKQDEVDIKTIFTNSIFKIVPNAGHWVQAEQPVHFHEVVSEFLK
ncbi:MAG: alpha/beta fold hydrolase [Bacteroidota bacterium]|nr:alpha/beta fold hydrolase [Bacteroidota bacterium]